MQWKLDHISIYTAMLVLGGLALVIFFLVPHAAAYRMGVTCGWSTAAAEPATRTAHDTQGKEPQISPRLPFTSMGRHAASTTGNFTPETGASVRIAGGPEVQVPPGAIPHPAEIHLHAAHPTERAPRRTDPVGETVWVLRAMPGDGTIAPVEEFDAPVTVQFPWDEKVVAAETLIHRHCPHLNIWIPLPTTLDHDRQGLRAQVRRPGVLDLQRADRPSDVRGHWAEAEILHIMAVNALGGYPDGTLRPDVEINREEFARMLVQTAGLDVRHPYSSPVADMGGELAEWLAPYAAGMGPPRLFGRLSYLIRDARAVSEWAIPYVEAAVTSRLMVGFADDTWRPDQPLTRVQMAVLLAQAMDLLPEPDELPFSDADRIPAWGRGAVGALTALGIMEGYPGGQQPFLPREKATRAEAATALSRALTVRLGQ